MRKPTETAPLALARLRRAIQALLRDHHGHSTPAELVACKACVARFWEHLEQATLTRPALL